MSEFENEVASRRCLHCCRRNKEDFASLEINVYEEKTGNLLVQDNFPLPAYPYDGPWLIVHLKILQDQKANQLAGIALIIHILLLFKMRIFLLDIHVFL